jgi:phosphoserine/homoserine phosphotransferase
MNIVCTDLEGVLVPEIWINVAEKTGIAELRLTTRDIADYDQLMRRRIAILAEHGLKLADITRVIATLSPLEGAFEFLQWLRGRTQVIIVSDTFVEFATPLMAKLDWPTLFCNSLQIDAAGAIAGYTLRQKDGKRCVVEALQRLNFRVIAMGDSYNDLSMIQKADHGILFQPPDAIRQSHPHIPVTMDYPSLERELSALLQG